MGSGERTPDDDTDAIHLEAAASGDARIYQAVGDQHVHHHAGVRSTRRAGQAVVVEQCPYPGLAAFGADQAEWFFGRESLTAELTDRLADRLTKGKPLAVVGPSGAGKSSLLRAGLLPALDRGALPVAGSRHWSCLTFTPTAHPMTALAGQFTALGNIEPMMLARELISKPDRCLEILHQALPGVFDRHEATAERVVLVLDQYEETFSMCNDEGERRAFIHVVAELARTFPGRAAVALVVLGLRADFYGQCLEYPELRAALQDGPVLVGPMSEVELREAILYPAQLVGMEVEAGLIEVLLRDLGTVSSDNSSVAGWSSDNGAGRLPLLAHALRATWQQRQGRTLTVAGYTETGGIQRAIARTAEDLFTALEPCAQEATRAVFLRLVRIGSTSSDTRRRLDRSALHHNSDPQIVSAVLGDY